MKWNVIVFFMVVWALQPKASTLSKTGSAEFSWVDNISPGDPIVPEENGELILSAKQCRGIGPTIKYMPEWEAFGFFREGNHIEWEIRVEKTRKYTVYLEWSAEGGVVGNPYVISIGKRILEGINKDSGSWETFIEEPIGVLKIRKGEHKVVFRPGDNIEKGGGMLDVKTIRLVPK